MTDIKSTRFTLKKHERLKSRTEISNLFKSNRSHFHFPIKTFFLIQERKSEKEWPLKMAVTVPKKNFKSAVDRNLIKRRIRESYRLNKVFLQNNIKSSKDIRVSLMMIYIGTEILPYDVIEKSVLLCIQRLSKETTPSS